MAGRFRPPAVNVYIEAPDLKTACSRTEPHFRVCKESGFYADYDSCGCCPCCGHRWSKPYNENPEEASEITDSIKRDGLKYFDFVATALIKENGSIVIGDTEDKLDNIIEYILGEL